MGMKNCVTCKHSDILEYKEPCASCENYQKWESLAPQWISVEDRLPEQPHKWDARGWYLVALKNGVVKELCYEFLESSVFGYGWRETSYPVTHWMPLPEPPKEE